MHSVLVEASKEWCYDFAFQLVRFDCVRQVEYEKSLSSENCSKNNFWSLLSRFWALFKETSEECNLIFTNLYKLILLHLIFRSSIWDLNSGCPVMRLKLQIVQRTHLHGLKPASSWNFVKQFNVTVVLHDQMRNKFLFIFLSKCLLNWVIRFEMF